MAIAAHTLNLYVKSSSSAPSSGDEIDGVNDVSVKDAKTMLDTTSFKDTSAAKTRLAGLFDPTVTISGHYLQSDTPQALLRSSFDSGSTVYITLLPDGTNGYTYAMIVESFEIKGSVDGLIEFSCSLVNNGARTARP